MSWPSGLPQLQHRPRRTDHRLAFTNLGRIPWHSGICPATARSGSSSGRRNVPELVDEVRRAIDQSDCVLAIITSWTGSFVQRELSYALAKRKLIIPIVEQGVQHPSFLSKFNRVFTFSRWNTDPGRLESEVLEFLKQQKLNKENQQAWVH